jgi:SAM-dependent methyltransferase
MDATAMFKRIIRDRLEFIRPHILRGSVLDLGCVSSRPAREGTRQRLSRLPDLLFKRICEINPDTTGVDIDAEGIELLRQAGYQAVCADVVTMDLGRQFDAIVAGEIIEHLDNPGLFLRNMRRHLKPTGALIVSTPNPFHGSQVWRIWRHGRPSVHEEHVGWHDPLTLTRLMQRSGLEVCDGCWLRPPKYSPLKNLRQHLRGYFSSNFMLLARPAGTTDK